MEDPPTKRARFNDEEFPINRVNHVHVTHSKKKSKEKRIARSRKKSLKQIPTNLTSLLVIIKDTVSPSEFNHHLYKVYHFSSIINSITYYNIGDDKVFTGEFTPEDPDECYCVLPEIHRLEPSSADIRGFHEVNEKMNVIINLVDIFMPLLRIKLITDNDDNTNYRQGDVSNNCAASKGDHCCGFMSTVSCVLAALNDYRDFKMLEDPMKSFKRIANIISSFTPYHKCIKDCPDRFEYIEEFDLFNGASLGSLYTDDYVDFVTLHTFCVYKYNNWVIIIDSWCDPNGARPLWGRIVPLAMFNKFIQMMETKRNLEFLEMFLDRFFIIPGSLPATKPYPDYESSSSDNSAPNRLPIEDLQVGFKNFREEDFLKRYPLTFAGSRKRKKLRVNKNLNKSKSK
jgi:hypothetical protein